MASAAPLSRAETMAGAVMARWHAAESAIAVLSLAFVALILILDVLGRELLGPALRALDLRAATGVFGSQKMAGYALVIASFAGIGVAAATASHIVPRVAFGWIPEQWSPALNRVADGVTGLFFVGAAFVAFQFVHSSMVAGLRTQAIDMPIWTVQVCIPLGFLSTAARYFCFALWPSLRPAPPEFQE